MAIPTIQTALNGGEFSPELFGRVDLDKYRKATSTLRNFYASYRGGASTRAGTRFVGVCGQGNQGTANTVLPPRNIPFQFSSTQGYVIEAGNGYFRFIQNGAYITEAPIAIAGVTTDSPAVVTTSSPHGYSTSNEIFLTGVVGPTGLDGRSFLITVIDATHFSLINPLDGKPASSLGMPAYVSGGTAARIYEIGTPYFIADVPLLKFAQSADTMSIVHPSYAPYELTRISSANWTLTPTVFGTSMPAPLSFAMSATDGATAGQARITWYQGCATAVQQSTGQESVASPIAFVESVDQALIAGSINMVASTVPGAGSYNFYMGPISINNPANQGGIFGYVGSAFGPLFTDTNVQPDLTISPPLNQNPFAVSSIIAVPVTAGGSGYDPTTTAVTCTSPINRNAALAPIISGGVLTWIVVQNGGEGYTGAEPVVISGGGGTGAAATLQLSPASGTYPSVVAYFQERRFYANTNNNPDTYFASQPGAFTNFDTSLPVKDDDAVIGSPWSQQVNGIQWMLNMPGGLVILTGLGAWQLSGGATGIATAAAVTPSNQIANPQAYNGVSPVVPPIPINYDILYVQERGSIVRNFAYNYFVNIYTGTDMTVLSNHLFAGHTILQWAWAEEPNKLVWCVRDDGVMLCLTYLKEQDVYAWSRHDTNGLFQSVCSISEPPVNATYVVVKRLIQNDGNPVWVYMQERMDNRLWNDVSEAWCVDCGLSYPQATPAASLTFSSSTGVPTLSAPVVVYGGFGYSSGTFAEISDPTGTGIAVELTISGGVVVAAVSSGTALTPYTNPVVTVIDPLVIGGDAVVTMAVQNLATVSASAGVFSSTPGSGAAGDVIRYRGSIMQVTQTLGASQIQVDVLRPIVSMASDPLQTAVPASPGSWTIAAPTTTLQGLNHLEGMQVSILGDGNVVAPQIVQNGMVTLPRPVTSAVVGLGFTAQLQTLYLDIQGGVTIQGRRKEIDQVIVRVSQTGTPFEIGANQPDASTQPGGIDVPWENMTGDAAPFNNSNPLQPFELFTGDLYAMVFDNPGDDKGQVAIQQTLPLPATVVAVMPWFRQGDDVDLPG